MKKPANTTHSAALETSNTTPAVQPIEFPSNTKPQTAKEVIAANVKLLIEQLEQGHSEGLTAYLTAMGRFHRYSLGNILEIARQKPMASRVAGMYAWNQLGRHVNKGEKGTRILAPVIGYGRKKDAEAEKDITKQNKPILVGFRAVYVFDRLSRDLRPARPATVLRRRVRGVHAWSSMAAATSSLISLARCKAVWIRTSSSSRAAICPAGSLCPFAAFRLR
jgi:hypothetical protein